MRAMCLLVGGSLLLTLHLVASGQQPPSPEQRAATRIAEINRYARGYATYRAIIRDVVFHRQPGNSPSLALGSQVEFTQSVGRDSAEAFVANRIPVVAGDECLLFLWPRPNGWGILNWHVQFRRSKELPRAAEMLGDPRAFKLRPEWFGGSVPATVVGEVVMPDWDGLVSETRRLGRR